MKAAVIVPVTDTPAMLSNVAATGALSEIVAVPVQVPEIVNVADEPVATSALYPDCNGKLLVEATGPVGVAAGVAPPPPPQPLNAKAKNILVA